MKSLKSVTHTHLDNTYIHHIGICPKNSHFVSTQNNTEVINIQSSAGKYNSYFKYHHGGINDS